MVEKRSVLIITKACILERNCNLPKWPWNCSCNPTSCCSHREFWWTESEKKMLFIFHDCIMSCHNLGSLQQQKWTISLFPQVRSLGTGIVWVLCSESHLANTQGGCQGCGTIWGNIQAHWLLTQFIFYGVVAEIPVFLLVSVGDHSPLLEDTLNYWHPFL